jgi:hypothetical protein
MLRDQEEECSSIAHLVRCEVARTSKSTNCTEGAVGTLVAKGSPSTKTPKKLPIKENNQPSRVCTKLLKMRSPKICGM